MLFVPTPLGTALKDKEKLKEDKKNCRKFGPCGIGKEALYLGGRFLDRRFYLPWRDIRRVFKRVAMSKNGFTGKGLFGSLPFLVVQYGHGEEKECPFKIESDIDRLLAVLEKEHPEIPTHSVKAEQKLAKARAQEAARYLKNLSPKASSAVQTLLSDKEFLLKSPALSDALSSTARQKRIADKMPRSFQIGAILLAAISIASCIFGLYGFLWKNSLAIYFLIGGAAVLLMTISSHALPGRHNNKKIAEKDWNESVQKMKEYLSSRQSFSVPPQYAHPIVLDRMVRVIREGRAETTDRALQVMKEDLRALNSSVTVSESERDEIVIVKPLFLVSNYQDQLS